MGLTVTVNRIPTDGMMLAGELPADELGLDYEGVTVAAPLEYDLHAEVAGHELLVRGSLRLPLAFTCSRCLASFDADVRVARYVFSAAVRDGDEIIDLTESVREDIIVALPVKPLCRPDCKGLCPRCGCDLNVGQCSCRTQGGDVRWGALDGVAIPPEKEG